MKLEVQLSQTQITAANKLRQDYLQRWQRTDAALEKLQCALPTFSQEECLIKAVAINAIYGANVWAIVLMGEHVAKVIGSANMKNPSPELVDHIAALYSGKRKTNRKHTSFAAKFCHFFVDKDRFPIYDDAACQAIKLHLGRKNYVVNKKHRYRAFCENFESLRNEAQLTCSTRDMDHYLWLVGMCRRWLKEPSKHVNAEVRELFEKPDHGAKELLRAILPADFATPLQSRWLSR